MPSRGVQDFSEINQKRAEERKKKQDKARKWCGLAGLTIVEFILCLACLGVAYATSLLFPWNLNIKYLMLPRVPVIVSSVYLAMTFVDLLSWCSLRPITYFSWIAASTSAFLMFMVYAGISLFNVSEVIGIVGIILGCITALVFLGDTICCLLSLKRFPVPYWLLKRKYDKFDQCVCTGDYDPNDAPEPDRPICRCGDNWGEPCACDDDTCGCGANDQDGPPCPCCECATQALVQDQDGTTVYGSEFEAPRKSIVTTASGRDYLLEEEEDPRKSTMVQVNIIPSPPPDVWCTDAPGGNPYPKVAAASSASIHTTKGAGVRSVSVVDPTRASYVSRKSTTSQRGYEIDTRKSASRRMTVNSKCPPTYSVYTAVLDQDVPAEGFRNDYSVPNLKLHEKLSKPQKDVKNVNLSGDAPLANLFQIYSTDEEFREGDYSRSEVCFEKPPKKKRGDKTKLTLSTYTTTDQEPIWGMSPSMLFDQDNLPGQVLEENYKKGARKRPTGYPAAMLDDDNLQQVSDRSFKKVHGRRSTAYPGGALRTVPSERFTTRPRSESLLRTVIRNVSTTVRPVRTLSSVMETSHESGSRSDVNRRTGTDTFPSECTITINK